MNETDLLNQLIGKRGLVELLGWTYTHSRPARTAKTYIDKKGEEKTLWVTPIQGTPGFPDLLMAKVCDTHGLKLGRVIYAELKGETEQPTPQQIFWLDLLAACWQETYLWRPSDFEEIQIILTMGHQPNLIERALLKSSWFNRREV